MLMDLKNYVYKIDLRMYDHVIKILTETNRIYDGFQSMYEDDISDIFICYKNEHNGNIHFKHNPNMFVGLSSSCRLEAFKSIEGVAKLSESDIANDHQGIKIAKASFLHKLSSFCKSIIIQHNINKQMMFEEYIAELDANMSDIKDYHCRIIESVESI